MYNNLKKGIKAENHIVEKIKEQIDAQIIQNHTHGIDIKILREQYVINIEVKSCQYLVKNGNKTPRKGNFSFYLENISRPDFFAFIVTNPTKKKKTYLVQGDVIREHFKKSKAKIKATL